MAEDRRIVFCKPGEPWDRKKGPWRVNHINAIEVSDEKDETNPDCRVVTSRCPNCGHEWRTRVEF